MHFSFLRASQWLGVAAGLFLLVGLNYDFDSEAGMRMNAPLDDPLSQGLRGYWKMDEGTGTSTTADASGNANTLSLTGPPSWTTGNIGPSAMDFSGSGQYLSVADPASGVLDFYGFYQNFTITGWFNRDTENTVDTLVAKRNSNGASDIGYLVWLGTDDVLNLEVSDGTAGGSNEYSVASSGTYAATGWHHFAAVWQGNVGMRLYVDGALSNSTSSSTTSIDDFGNALAFSIGAESDAGNPFDGKIDDIRVYGSALSGNDVLKLYQTTAPTQPVDTGLVGHWTFDGPDTSLLVAFNSGVGGNDGLITGAVPTIGKLGQGMSFNGTSDYVDAGDNSSLNLTSSFTISAWVNGRSFPGGYRYQIVSKGTRGGNGYFLFVDVAGFIGGDQRFKFGFTTGGGWNTVDSNTIVTTGVWRHVVGVFDNTANTLKIYVNGALDGTTTSVTNVPGSTASINNLTLGAYDAGNYEYFPGKLDDVRIYNRALSAVEVADLYNAGK